MYWFSAKWANALWDESSIFEGFVHFRLKHYAIGGKGKSGGLDLTDENVCDIIIVGRIMRGVAVLFRQIAIAAIFITYVGAASCHGDEHAGPRRSSSDGGPGIGSWVESSAPAAVLPCQDQAGRKPPVSQVSSKHILAAPARVTFSRWLANYRAARWLQGSEDCGDEHALISLHCLLTV